MILDILGYFVLMNIIAAYGAQENWDIGRMIACYIFAVILANILGVVLKVLIFIRKK